MCLKADFDAAIYNYKKTIDYDPYNAPAFYNLGNAYYMKNEFEKAIFAYNSALKLNPDSAECHFNIASAYNDKGDFDNALKHYRQSLQYDPKNSETYVNIGAILEKRSFQEATDAYQTALKLNPDNPKAIEGIERVEKLKDQA